MIKVWLLAGLVFAGPLFAAAETPQSVVVSFIISPKHGHITVLPPECSSLAEVIVLLGKIKASLGGSVTKIHVAFGNKLKASSFDALSELETYLSSGSTIEMPTIISIHLLSISDVLEAQIKGLLGEVVS